MIIFKRKNPKALYITGWPGTGRGDGNILTLEYLTEIGFDIIDVEAQYDKESPKIIMERIKKTIRDNKIELVFALSTGGLFATCLKGVSKILINPCFNIGTFLMFNPQVPLEFSKEMVRMKKEDMVIDKNTYGFFSLDDDVAHSREDFIKKYGKSFEFDIKNSQHVPRSFEWNEQIIPVLRKITGLNLGNIQELEFSSYPEKKTYAWVDGIRLPGFKTFPETIFNLRLKWLKSKGIEFEKIEINNNKD